MNKQILKTLTKYQKKNNSPYHLNSIDNKILQRTYSMLAVMPVFGEFQYLPKTLESIADAINKNREESVLIIIVVNNPDKKLCSPVKFTENQQTLESLKSGNFPLHLHSSLAWIDASSPGKELKKGNGVGAARKTGMDAALSLCDWDNAPLLLCLDGDTLVEDNYFTAVRDFFTQNPVTSAAVVDFNHQQGATPEEEEAIRLYESYMFDYVKKLRFAHSPYAYHAIGSTITCRAEGYLKSGGMRPKEAGEDFYFLQALRKLSPNAEIGEIKTTAVHPSARASDRVPFGTGARITELLSGVEAKYPGKYLYNPNIFNDLKKLIQLVDNENFLQYDTISYDSLPETIVSFLNSCDFTNLWPKISKNTPDDIKKKQWAFHTWFDAFRTLKFIHFCESYDPDKYGRILNIKSQTAPAST